jgi:uncharacterized membrane protein YraQ (UPF0718 family)
VTSPTPPRKKVDWSLVIVGILSFGAAAITFFRDGSTVFLAILGEDSVLFLEIVPKVLAGSLIGVLVRLLVPREKIAHWLGAGSGWKGLLIASLAGVLIPAGPFTVFPLAGSMLMAGADAGAAVAFVTAWLLLGINRAIVWEQPFFGLHFVAIRMLVSLWVPPVLGYAARVLALRAKAETLPEGAE